MGDAMKPNLVPVETLYESNYRDPVKTLRVVADEIEAGKYGAVGEVALVILGDTCELFSIGEQATPPSTALLLQAGAHRMIDAIARHGRE